MREQLKQLESKQLFSCKVLISTSILDCGVNIVDDAVQNIVIFEIEKTTFIQMLGRVRVQSGRKVRLFIKAPTALEIRDSVRYACKNIRVMCDFYMIRKNNYSGNGMETRFEPVMGMKQRQYFLRNLKGANYQNIYIRPDLINVVTGINDTVQRAWKEKKFFRSLVKIVIILYTCYMYCIVLIRQRHICKKEKRMIYTI